MIILAAMAIRGIAVGAIRAATSAVNWACTSVENAQGLDHEQTLLLYSLYRQAAAQGVEHQVVWAAIELTRSGLASGAIDPDVASWVAALDPETRSKILLLAARQ